MGILQFEVVQFLQTLFSLLFVPDHLEDVRQGVVLGFGEFGAVVISNLTLSVSPENCFSYQLAFGMLVGGCIPNI